MFGKKLFSVTVLLVMVASLISGCATPTPEVVEKVVTQVVKETVKETVIVEGTPQVVEKEVTKVIEKEVTRVVEVEAPKGGEITLIWGGTEPPLLDAQVTGWSSAAAIAAWMGGTLIDVTAEGEFVPYLAESWEVSDDGTVWTFKLRQDVTFHDGTPFNAEAVKFNFDRILDPETQSSVSASIAGSVAATEVIDEFTFQLTHKEPFAPFLNSISEGFFSMWSPTAVEKYGNEFKQHLIGAGPFMMVEWAPADKYVLVKNPDYNWAPSSMRHQGPAYLDKITLRFVKEAATQVAIWKAGEAELFFNFPASNLPEAQQDAGTVTMMATRTGSPGIHVFNVDRFPTDDINVRKAAQFAINSKEIADVVYRGGAVPVEHIMYPGSQCYWKEGESMYPYDPERGKAILEEAGWVDSDGDGIREKDGQPLEILILNTNREEIGTLLQDQLKKIGIGSKVDFVPDTIQIQRAQVGDFNTIGLHWAHGDPGILDMLWNSKNLKTGGWSWSRFKDARLDEVLNASSVEVDPEKRCEFLVEAQQIIQENALALPLFAGLKIVVYDDSVRGFRYGSRPDVDAWLYDTYVE